MPRLSVNKNYLLRCENSVPTKIKKHVNKPYKLIKNVWGNKLLFSNGENNITLWKWEYDFCDPFYSCYITLERNNNYRTTEFPLNVTSIDVYITILDIDIETLKSYGCIRTVDKFVFLVGFYNKINVKKNLNKDPIIAKVFQNNFMVQYISEFL